jgi:cytochrome d ubiquinol oxidase subunit II
VIGVLTLALVWTRRLAYARYTSAAAVACITVGWAFAQSPYLLPGELTLDQAAAGDSTLTALLISIGVGLVLLVPSLIYLYRLVLKGTLSQDFQALDQRFRPLTTDDHPVEPPA